MKISLFIIACLAVTLSAGGQTGKLYAPFEFQKAYKKGTRKADGSVSPTYWQNRSDYKLKAKVDPKTKKLEGEGVITYYNNSPDSLTQLVFHTYPDYYKEGSKRAGFFAGNEYLKNEGMVITKFAINGRQIKFTPSDSIYYNGTNYTVRLAKKKKIAPKSSVEIEVSWNYQIPGKGFERSGAIDSTSMFIGYWYPEMSVLDDIYGWDRVVYDAATEFYHDYSTYEVEITAPDDFMVWASVAANNPTEVYSKTIQDRIAKAKKSTEPVSIYTPADFNKGKGKTLTWKYTATDFPDFSFALSNHFVWDAASYKDSFGEYFINTAYPVDHKEFTSVLKTISKSIEIFHTKFPVQAFPFKNFTIFNGLEGGGMEFPGMANDEGVPGEMMSQWTGKKVDDYEANLGLSLHEMCHMYFPFMMGINEKKYAWMDEGMASFSEYFMAEDNDSPYEFDSPNLASLTLAPVMVPSHLLANSGTNSYTIGSMSYISLYQLLGKDVFTKCLGAYMNEWKRKHPTPYDFMNTFNRVSGKDLNWFWKQWYFDWGYMDLAITDYSQRIVTLENVGGRPMAANLIITYSDDTKTTEVLNPSIWKDGTVYKYKVNGSKEVKSIRLTIEGGVDAIASNNNWPAKR
jgi:Peptidase family M1 domain